MLRLCGHSKNSQYHKAPVNGLNKEGKPVSALTREAVRNKSAKEGVYYVDRKSGEIHEEVVFGRGFMEFFYENGFGRFLTSTFFVRRWLSVLYGWYNDSRLSRRKIQGFIEKLSIPLDEVVGKPEDHTSFNDFFARRLKPEARPYDDNPKVLISPTCFLLPLISKRATERIMFSLFSGELSGLYMFTGG